jgi:hypothetical protein
MNLTESQKAEIARARAEGRHRIMSEYTPEQRADWERRVAAEMAFKDERIQSIHKRDAAALEPGFSGDLRRAIAASGAIDADLLESFCEGEAELPSNVIDKLVEHLGLQLVKALS